MLPLVLCATFVGVSAWQSVLPIKPAHSGLSRSHRSAVQPTMDFRGDKNRFKANAAPGEVAQVPFEIRFSIGNVISVSGGALFVYSLGTYLLNNGQVSHAHCNRSACSCSDI